MDREERAGYFSPEPDDVRCTSEGFCPLAAHDRHGVVHYLDPSVMCRLARTSEGLRGSRTRREDERT